MNKTAIQIIPNQEGDTKDYLIICMDEQAYADFLAGKYNPTGQEQQKEKQ